jgi:hypothetical protein
MRLGRGRRGNGSIIVLAKNWESKPIAICRRRSSEAEGISYVQCEWGPRRRDEKFHWRRVDEALLLESQVLALKKPTQRTLRNVKRWFSSGGQTVLLGRDTHLFDDKNDMVALAPLDDDRLSRLLRAVFGWCFEVNGSWAHTLTPWRSNLTSFRIEILELAGWSKGTNSTTFRNGRSNELVLSYRSYWAPYFW